LMTPTGPGTVRPPDDVRPLDTLSPATVAEWSALVTEQGGSFFCSPTWVLTWCRTFASGQPTLVATWRADGVLTGLAAMVPPTARLLAAEVPLSPRLKVWEKVGAGGGGADHREFPCRTELRAST